MSTYNETLHFLYDLQRFGIKVGLRNIRSLCSFLEHPERKFPSIHIAGTNGKGSTAAMIASVLTAAGYRTGLYTSPHLVRFNERVCIDGRPIVDDDVVGYTKTLKQQIQKLRTTFFEATTAIAFQFFADQQVDIAVIETGLGGRWDATNVITPLLSIITNIGLEHTEYLGSTYRQIAFEKAGIIKKGIPCITGTTEPAALHTLKKIAASKSSILIHVDEVSTMTVHKSSIDGLNISLDINKSPFDQLTVSLAGDHQARNAQLAILALQKLEDREGLTLSASIGRGLSSVQQLTGLHGRIDVLSRSPLIIADVAHNPDGMQALVATLRKLLVGWCVVVFGVMKDKDYRLMIRHIGQIARIVIAVQPKMDRALEDTTIISECHTFGRKAINGGSIAKGLEIARREGRMGETIVVTGSHYVVGEAMLHV